MKLFLVHIAVYFTLGQKILSLALQEFRGLTRFGFDTAPLLNRR